MDYQNKLSSVKLYQYLSDVVVGSEKVVKYRRHFYKCRDDYLNMGDVRIISSGSKAEGLDLPGSDEDAMWLFYAYMVHEQLENTSEQHLILDTDNAMPGFALIKMDGSLLQHDILKQTSLEDIEKHSVLCDSIKKLNTNRYTSPFKIQGPALSLIFKGIVEMDCVLCLPCCEWPTIAKRWLDRGRCCQWPYADLITEAIHEGVTLVPVGSKSLSSEENISEWRLSFALTEKLLVHSFNHTQLLCYALLKICLKEIIEKINIFNKLLCSYYIKTVLFWVLEEVESSYWVPGNLLRCFTVCLTRLHYFILCNYIPNYFIPEHNLIEGRFSEKVRKQLEIFIEKLVIGNIWEVLLSLDLLSDFSLCKSFHSKSLHAILEFDKTWISMKFPDFVDNIGDISLRSLSFFISRIQNENCPTFFKNIYAIALLDWCKSKAISIKMRSVESQYCSNKHYYSQYKQCLFHLLLNLNADAVSGWLLLAAFYLSCQEYRKMNNLLQLSEEILSRDLFTLSHYGDASAITRTPCDNLLIPSGHFLKRLRHSMIRLSMVQKKERTSNIDDSFIFHKDLCNCNRFFSIGTPIVFIRYLEFLVFHKENNTEGMNRVLMLIQEEVEKSPKLDGLSIAVDFAYLVRAQICHGGYKLETIKTFFSVIKPFDVTGFVSYRQSLLKKEFNFDLDE